MWLLSTNRAELRYFSSADVVDGGYAILSHTWTGDEQTFQQVRAIEERCRRNGTNPRDDPELSPKIRECCILAEKDGYRWAWVDSSCIDKTSSSELSEAINSMFQWYSQAEVCYAYLADVPSNCILQARNSAFRRSRWHTRGWTLQELIAPAFLIFLSADWRELGNKADLASLLHEITRIDARVLTREYTLGKFSVSTRMFWASARKTTRVEDEAYCLMGIFGVSMPTNYGEGRNAFKRLQHEIMRCNPDMSLFAFGPVFNDGPLSEQGFTLNPNVGVDNPLQYLLAPSPRDMTSSFDFTPDIGSNSRQPYPPLYNDASVAARLFRRLRARNTSPFDSAEFPHVTVTSYGIELRLPVFEADGVTVAVLLCEDRRHHFGLFLQRDPNGKDLIRPRYYVGCVCTHAHNPIPTFTRMANLGDNLYNLRFNGMPVKARWRTVYVVPAPPQWDRRSGSIANITINCDPAPPFRLPHWLVSRCAALQFQASEKEHSKSLTIFELYHPGRNNSFWILLGLCSNAPGNAPARWARIMVGNFIRTVHGSHHDCSEHHIASWMHLSKGFGDAERTIRLSFTPCKRWPEKTLIIHIELSGRIYEQMLRDANLSFPSLLDLRTLLITFHLIILIAPTTTEEA